MHKHKHSKLRTAVILFAIATLIIHLVNKFIVASATFRDMLDVLNRKYFKSKFGNIYYNKRGHGTPLLLIHDSLPGSSGYEWNKIDKLLATEHTVYTIDLLGFGRSDKPGLTYTNYLFVQLITEFIEKVIGQKTDVIVSGISSSYVIMAANEKKELFGKILAVNPSNPDFLNKELTIKDKIHEIILKLPVFGTLIYHMFVSRETINKLFADKFFYNYSNIDKDTLDAYREAAHKGGYFAKYLYISLVTGKLNVNLSHGIKSLQHDLMIIQGEYDSNNDIVSKTYQELNSAISLNIIPNTKRYPQIENPEKFLEQAGYFFK